MSITETTRRAGPYATDGSQVEFPFAFKVFKAEDVVVTRSENGLDTDLTLTTDYTVNLNSNQDAAPGGEVVLTSAPNGPTITITSGMAATQPTVFTNAGGFFPRVLNDSLDRVTILIQQLMERVSRVPLLPLGDAPVGQFPVVLPNGKFGWSTGSGTDSGLRADLGTDAPGKGADIVAGVATTAALASTDPGKGAGMVTWLREAAAAVALSVRKKLSERVTPLDFGAAGDADPSDNTVGTDDSAAVQAAFDYCATHPGTSLCLAGRYYKVQWVRIPPRPDRRRWFVFGEGGGFVNPATSASEAPCLFHSSLANSGDASRSYPYGTSVSLYGVNFHGGGYGVGYMHALASQISVDTCIFSKLGVGFLTLGCVGIQVRNPIFNECIIAAHAAKNAEYAWTAGYTQEASTGWNDGYLIEGGQFRGNERGLVYAGSENEGVVEVRNMVWTTGRQSYVETYGNMRSCEISHVWTEYTQADADGNAVADIIRFWRSTGADTGGESPARFSVHHCNFYLSPPLPVNGVNRYAVRSVINARVNVHIHDNVFTSQGVQSIYDTIIYNSIGSHGTPIPNLSLTPADTSEIASDGRIAFTDADIESLGDREGIMYMLSGGKTYALSRYGTYGVGGSRYNIHKVQFVYSPQFAGVSDQWIAKANQKNRADIIGVVIDFETNDTTMDVPAGDVTLMAGISGGVLDLRTGGGTGGRAIMERNVCQSIDMRRFYAQREFGRYIMRDNIKRA